MLVYKVCPRYNTWSRKTLKQRVVVFNNSGAWEVIYIPPNFKVKIV